MQQDGGKLRTVKGFICPADKTQQKPFENHFRYLSEGRRDEYGIISDAVSITSVTYGTFEVR